MNILFVYQTQEALTSALVNTFVLNGTIRWKTAEIVIGNGDRIQFRLLRTLEDCNQIAGCMYNTVQFVGEASDDVKSYVMTRLRQPFKE